MKTLINTTILAVILLVAFTTLVTAQDSIRSSPSGSLKSVITGDVFFGYQYSNDSKNGNTSTFTKVGYNPVVLYKLSDKLFFEGEVEFQLGGGSGGFAAGEGLEVELEYANLNFVINKYMLLKAGTFFSCFGVFEDWYHQRITNRLTSRPLGIGHHGIEPGTEMGIALNGGIPLGSAKLHYAINLLNGPTLLTEDEDAGNLEYESIIDNNTNKALAARIGILPVSWLEFGGWIGTSVVGGAKDPAYKNIGATHSGAYFSFIKDIDALNGTVILRSQYSNLSVDKANYIDTATGTSYTFDNKSSAYYAQLSYRPTMGINKIIKRLEFVGRYGAVDYPGGAKWGQDASQWAFALDYWLKWNAVIKLSYEQNTPVKGTKPPANYFVQIAFGL